LLRKEFTAMDIMSTSPGNGKRPNRLIRNLNSILWIIREPLQRIRRRKMRVVWLATADSPIKQEVPTVNTEEQVVVYQREVVPIQTNLRTVTEETAEQEIRRIRHL